MRWRRSKKRAEHTAPPNAAGRALPGRIDWFSFAREPKYRRYGWRKVKKLAKTVKTFALFEGFCVLTWRKCEILQALRIDFYNFLPSLVRFYRWNMDCAGLDEEMCLTGRTFQEALIPLRG